jgi:hypothetical protein
MDAAIGAGTDGALSIRGARGSDVDKFASARSPSVAAKPATSAPLMGRTG